MATFRVQVGRYARAWVETRIQVEAPDKKAAMAAALALVDKDVVDGVEMAWATKQWSPKEARVLKVQEADNPDGDGDCAPYECGNCMRRWKKASLIPYSDDENRVAAGLPVPDGECPACGGACDDSSQVDCEGGCDDCGCEITPTDVREVKAEIAETGEAHYLDDVIRPDGAGGYTLTGDDHYDTVEDAMFMAHTLFHNDADDPR